MMKTSKQPISHALTSLNGISADFAEPSSTKPGAKVRHLPNAIGKKKEGDLRSPLDIVIERSRDFFFREQLPQGYWWAELESNVTITAEYIMLFHFLGIVKKERERKMANYLLSKQTKEGFWTIYYGGPGDISTSVEAYFALKLAGYAADHPAMAKARAFILKKGGSSSAASLPRYFSPCSVSSPGTVSRPCRSSRCSSLTGPISTCTSFPAGRGRP